MSTRFFVIHVLSFLILGFLECVLLAQDIRSPAPPFLGSSPRDPSAHRPHVPPGVHIPGTPLTDIPLCPNSKSLRVSLWKQETVSWCWAASAQTIMDYRGVKEEQCFIVDSVRQNQLGDDSISTCCIAKRNNTLACTFLGEPEWALDEFNFTYHKVGQDEFGWSELCREISSDRPFIYAESYEDGGGHTYVIRGFGKDADGAQIIEIYDHDPQFVGTSDQTDFIEWPYESIRIPENGEDPFGRSTVDYYINIHT